MKRALTAIGLLAFAVVLAAPSQAMAGMYAEVTLAPLGRHHRAPPPLGRKQGWLTISNRDWSAYTLVVERNDKLFLYRAGEGGYGGMVIPSGSTVTIALEKDTYDLYGNSSDRLKVKIREGRTTSLALEPFGYVGSTGLRGVVNDGDRVRNGVIFDSYATTVVVPAPPPTVIVNRPPPPPPVIINRPPVVHRPPPPPPGRPGRPGRPGGPGHRPPPPPHHGDSRKDGWGFVFGFGKN